MDETDRLSVLLGGERVLPSRKVTSTVDTTLHLCVEDAVCVRTVVAVIEQTERPNHEVSDSFEVVKRRRMNDNVVNDR